MREKQENEVIVKDSVDRQSFETIFDKSKPLQDKTYRTKEIFCREDLAIKEVAYKSNSLVDFLGDIHSSLFKHKPASKERKDIALSRIPNKLVIDEMLKTNEYQQLHAITKSDNVASAIGTVSLSDNLIEQLQEFPDLANLEEKIDQLNGLAKTIKDFKGNPGKINAEIRGIQHKQLPESTEKLKNKIQEFKSQDVRNIARKACKQAIEDTQRTLSAFESWGNCPGVPVSVDISEALEFAKTLVNNPKLKQIALLAGKMRNIALNKRETKADKSPNEVIDLEYSSNLSNVIPSEYLLIDTPIFDRKYTENTLLSRKMQGKQKQGKGPIVVCLDESGSMQGNREVWAKAYFLGLQALAAKDKRPIAYLSFDCTVNQSHIFEKGLIPSDSLTEMLSCFSGGGTNFDHPLNKAMDYIERYPLLKDSDIILISDGLCSIKDITISRFHNMRSKFDFSFYVIMIDSKAMEYIKPLADKIIEITGKEDSEALEVFEKV